MASIRIKLPSGGEVTLKNRPKLFDHYYGDLVVSFWDIVWVPNNVLIRFAWNDYVVRNVTLWEHEYWHQVQRRRDGRIRWYWRYLTDGEWKWRYECEAYGRQVALSAPKDRMHVLKVATSLLQSYRNIRKSESETQQLIWDYARQFVAELGGN